METLTKIGSSHPRETDRVRSVLLDSGIFPARLAEQQAFITDCAELAETLRRGGVRSAIRAALEQADSERSESDHD